MQRAYNLQYEIKFIATEQVEGRLFFLDHFQLEDKK